MQAPAIHLWTGGSISELEYTLDELIKAYGFMQTFGKACIYKKVSGSTTAFLISNVNDILPIGNDVEFSGKHKGVFERSSLKERPQ